MKILCQLSLCSSLELVLLGVMAEDLSCCLAMLKIRYDLLIFKLDGTEDFKVTADGFPHLNFFQVHLLLEGQVFLKNISLVCESINPLVINFLCLICMLELYVEKLSLPLQCLVHSLLL